MVTFIQNHLKYYTLTQLCTALKFPRSTYYKALVGVPSNRQKVYETFSQEVKRIYNESKGIYGAVKICRSLNDNGIPCSLKRVQRLCNLWHTIFYTLKDLTKELSQTKSYTQYSSI